MPTFDVAIVGCGPVGVMAGLRCAQQGLSVVAVDKAVGIYPLPRAIGLDAEGQRLMHTAGLGGLLAKCSTPMPGAEFVNAAGERVVGLDLPPGYVTPLGHPPMVAFEQPALEAGMRAAAVIAGVDVRLGVEAVGLTTTEHGVELETTSSNIRARWLIGADGATSWVRSECDIGLDDQGFDQPWLVVDTTLLEPNLALPPLMQQICDPERVVTFVIGHGTRRRWEFQMRPGETRDKMLQPETVTQLLSRWGTPDQLQVDRSAVYRFHGLVAKRFRRGPVFLSGDAAHQMPPFNGQGMMSGLRDADNLAWKLALVHRGIAGDALLDTYDQERRPHAVATVEHSCDAGRLIDDIAAGVDVSPEAGYGGGRSRPFLEAGFLDGDHPAVGRPVAQPMIDGVMLDALMGDGFALVSIDKVAMPSELARAGTTAAQVRPGVLRFLDDGAAAIVRPDRYVAAVTSDLAAATANLASIGELSRA